MINPTNKRGAAFIIFTVICTGYLVYIGKADIYFIILLFMFELFIKNCFDFLLLLNVLSKDSSSSTLISPEENQEFGTYQSGIKSKKTKYFDIQYSYHFTKIPKLTKLKMDGQTKFLRIILFLFKLTTQFFLFFGVFLLLLTFAIDSASTNSLYKILSFQNFSFILMMLLIILTELFSFLDKAKVKSFTWKELPILPPKEYVLIYFPLFIGIFIFSLINYSHFYFILPFLIIKLIFDLYMNRKSLV